MASSSALRTAFGPGPGKDVSRIDVEPGDWAYLYGYWFKVVAFGTDDQVHLERPGWPRKEAASVFNIKRWRKA